MKTLFRFVFVLGLAYGSSGFAEGVSGLAQDFTAKWGFAPDSSAAPCADHLQPGARRQECAADLANYRARAAVAGSTEPRSNPQSPVTRCFDLQYENYDAYVGCVNGRRSILQDFISKWGFDPESSPTPCYDNLLPGPRRQECAADLANVRARGNDLQAGIQTTLSIVGSPEPQGPQVVCQNVASTVGGTYQQCFTITSGSSSATAAAYEWLYGPQPMSTNDAAVNAGFSRFLSLTGN